MQGSWPPHLLPPLNYRSAPDISRDKAFRSQKTHAKDAAAPSPAAPCQGYPRTASARAARPVTPVCHCPQHHGPGEREAEAAERSFVVSLLTKASTFPSTATLVALGTSELPGSTCCSGIDGHGPRHRGRKHGVWAWPLFRFLWRNPPKIRGNTKLLLPFSQRTTPGARSRRGSGTRGSWRGSWSTAASSPTWGRPWRGPTASRGPGPRALTAACGLFSPWKTPAPASRSAGCVLRPSRPTGLPSVNAGGRVA